MAPRCARRAAAALQLLTPRLLQQLLPPPPQQQRSHIGRAELLVLNDRLEALLEGPGHCEATLLAALHKQQQAVVVSRRTRWGEVGV